MKANAAATDYEHSKENDINALCHIVTFHPKYGTFFMQE